LPEQRSDHSNRADAGKAHRSDIEEIPAANAFGIISLPTMIVVDPDGKVVNRNIRTPSELDRFLESRMSGLDAAARRPAGERR